jgi:hypothetical protein
MKHSNLIFLTIIATSIFCIGAISSSNLEKGKKSDLTHFEIKIHKTENGIQLSCLKGCAWKKLSWSQPWHPIQKINEYGMVTDSNSEKNNSPDLADFEITVHKTTNGIKLVCSKGCAWKKLSWTQSGHTNQKVNEYGMVTDSSN